MRKLDFSKLKFSDKVTSTKEALKDVEPWIKNIEGYIKDIDNGKVTPQESLNSLIKAGICNKNGDLTEPYKIKEEPEEKYCTVAESLEQSLKEIQLIRQGKLPEKVINEVLEELDNEQ